MPFKLKFQFIFIIFVLFLNNQAKACCPPPLVGDLEQLKFLLPELSVQEIKLLDDHEKNVRPFEWKPAAPQKPIADANPNTSREISGYHYLQCKNAINSKSQACAENDLISLPINIDQTLNHSTFIDFNNTLTPQINIHVNGVEKFQNHKMSYYYEVDKSPSFDSNTLLRFPNLVPIYWHIRPFPANLPNTKEINLNPLVASTSNFKNSAQQILPIPSFIFGLDEQKLTDQKTYFDLLAQSLKAKNEEKTVQQIFNFTRFNLLWGNSTISKSAIQALTSGIAGCGDINEVGAYFSEINGFKSRMVGGFNPIFRQWFPGGGHSAVEIKIKDKWAYYDSFLDIFSPNASAYDFQRHPLKNTIVIDNFDKNKIPQQLQNAYSKINLQQLFKYRVYGDRASRLAMARMSELHALPKSNLVKHKEDIYGLNFELRQPDEKLTPLHFKEKDKLYIRTRFAVSDCEIQGYNQKLCFPKFVKMSPWVVQSIDLEPRNNYLKSLALSH